MKKIVSLLIPLLPIFAIYKSPIPKVDLGTFFACIVFIFALLELKKKGKNNLIILKKKPVNYLLLYCLYIIVGFLICIFAGALNVPIMTIFSRVIKMCLFILFINLCISADLFDYQYSFRFYTKIIIVSCILLIVQTLSFYFLKRNFYGVIMPLILQGDYQYVDYNSMSMQYLYRPCAFFLEPSGLTSYFSLFLAILLNKKPTKKSVLLAIFVTFCMILSTSGQAYLYGGILWLIFILKCFKKYLTKKTVLVLLIFAIVLPVLVFKLYNTDIVYKSIQRIIDGSASGGNAITSRTFSISYYKKLPLINKIFGVGYGNPVPNIYFNSLNYTLYCSGIIGLIIILMFFLKSYKLYDKKNFVIYWLVSIMFSTTFIATNIGFYLPFLSNSDEEVNKT